VISGKYLPAVPTLRWDSGRREQKSSSERDPIKKWGLLFWITKVKKTGVYFKNTKTRKPILILGIGNLLLKDEGVGIHVVQKMKKMHLFRRARFRNVEIMDGGTAGLDLLSYMEGRKKVIVIDSVRGGRKPGTIYRLTPENLKTDTNKILSLHQIDFQQALHLAGQLGKYPEAVIIGIEPKDFSSWGMELSPVIRKRIPKIIELVMEEVK